MIIFVLPKRMYMWPTWFNICILIFINHVPYVTWWFLRLEELWWGMVFFLSVVCGLSLSNVCTFLRTWLINNHWGCAESYMEGDNSCLLCKKYSGHLGSSYLDACINLLNQNPCKKYSGHLGAIVPRCLYFLTTI